nr:gastrula zinc finger protein XlCGF67.1-like [Dermacentor andersoni]
MCLCASLTRIRISFRDVPLDLRQMACCRPAERMDEESFYTKVCSRHFKQKDFIEGKRRRLKKGTTRWQQSAHQHVDLSARQAGPESSLPATGSSDLCLSENVHINKLYVCSYCHKSFTVRTKLTTHLRIHTGERPFHCHLCPLAFTQKAHLVYHVRTHTGERPFQCRFCPKAFARKLRRKHHEIFEHWRGTTAP